MLFDLRALGYFVAAYEERSITAAARRCCVAQPSISMAVKGLEDALEIVLFERSRHGLAPTPAGERLYPRACSLLAQSTAMVRDFRDTPRASLGLYLQDDVLVHTAAPLLALLDQHLPGTSLRLTASMEEAQLGLVAESCKRAADVFVPLWREPYVMLVPESHPLRFRKHFEWSDLQAREELLLHMVELGLGLAIIPASHAHHARKAIARPLQTGPMTFERHLGLACTPQDAPVHAVLDTLATGMRARQPLLQAA